MGLSGIRLKEMSEFSRERSRKMQTNILKAKYGDFLAFLESVLPEYASETGETSYRIFRADLENSLKQLDFVTRDEISCLLKSFDLETQWIFMGDGQHSPLNVHQLIIKW
jgi:BMFP domain-containing protein YqiC